MLLQDYQPFTLTITAGLSQVVPVNNADGINVYAICDATTTDGELGIETAARKDQAGTWPEDDAFSFTGSADGEYHISKELTANFVRIRVKSGLNVVVKLQRWRKGGGL